MILKIAILALSVLASEATEAKIDETGCPVTFQKKCHCGMAYSRYDGAKEKKFTVNCTNSGFTTADMLMAVPDNTQVLIFVGNSVSTLPINIIDNSLEYNDLETIDMSKNHIRFIQGKTFHKVYNVKTLILDHNDIDISDEKSRPRMFSNFENLERLHLTNAFTEKVNASDYLLDLEDIFYESELIYLKVLHLEQNEIWSINGSGQVFCQLTAIEQLLLGDNRLTDMDFHIDCLKKLRYIDLERNMISRLSKEAMEQLDIVAKNKETPMLQIKLENNPFNCDCRATHFLDWFKTTEVEVIGWKNYLCLDGYPNALVGKTFDKVDGKLQCPTTATSHSASQSTIKTINTVADVPDDPEIRRLYSSATIGILSFLLVFTSSMLLAVAYFQRHKLKNIFLPYWDFLTRKIGYTGISNDETPQEVNV